MGMLFAILGLILTVFGEVSSPTLYEQSLGIDINFSWGLALLCFGIVMLILGTRAMLKRRTPTPSGSDHTQKPE